MVVSFAVRIKS